MTKLCSDVGDEADAKQDGSGAAPYELHVAWKIVFVDDFVDVAYFPIREVLSLLCADKPITWRQWLFSQCHEGPVQAHRTNAEAFH